MKQKLITTLSVLLFITSCKEQNQSKQATNEQGQSEQNQASSGSLEEAKKAIAESNALYFTSYVKNDSSIMIDRYTDDACLMEPNKPQACGKEAVAEFFRINYAKGRRNGEFITTTVYGDAKEYVTEEGTLKVFDGQGNVMGKGKYLVLWKKTPNGWKMFRDAFSRDAP